MWYTVVIDKPDETAIACQPASKDGQRRSRAVSQRVSRSYPEYQFVINFTPVAGMPQCHYPLLIEKKTAQGVKHLCASKQYWKAGSVE